MELAHYIHIIKNQSFYTRESFTHILLLYSTETEKEKASQKEEGGGGGGGRLLEAVNVIFKTCNLQSNDAILIINVLVLDLVIGFKAKTKETIGVGCWDKVLREIS